MQVTRFVGAVAVAIAVCAGCRSGDLQREGEDRQSAPPGVFEIALDTSGPLRISAAPLMVTVHENGRPATNVDVSIELRMPETPTMGEMRTGAALQPEGEGRFRGQVDMMMAGQWNAIVRVKRAGQVVATHTQPVTAAQ